VKVLGAPENVTVSIAQTLELNQPHVFAIDVTGKIILEDGLVFNCKGISEKAKLIEMALKLAPLVEKLDFRKPEAFEL